jgi:hypothetical protein
MKYRSAVAFRVALDQRIQRIHQEQGLSHLRIRKLIVCDRFLARLSSTLQRKYMLTRERTTVGVALV